MLVCGNAKRHKDRANGSLYWKIYAGADIRGRYDCLQTETHWLQFTHRVRREWVVRAQSPIVRVYFTQCWNGTVISRKVPKGIPLENFIFWNDRSILKSPSLGGSDFSLKDGGRRLFRSSFKRVSMHFEVVPNQIVHFPIVRVGNDNLSLRCFFGWIFDPYIPGPKNHR